jgi:hypothetical protein
MKLTFTYNEDEDINCLLSKGTGSINSPNQSTKTYLALLEYTKDIDDKEKVREFVQKFRSKSIENNVVKLQENWDSISDEYQKRAETVFGISLTDSITAYLTITGRYPYSVQGKYFFVPANKENANSTCMHELWHFYTWHKFGAQQETIGATRYNDVKEALTALLNIECADLMNGDMDNGYPQHQELRARIAEIWGKTRDIGRVWEECVKILV